MNKIKSDLLKVNREINIQKTEDDINKVKEKINAQFTQLQPWLNRLGEFLHDELTDNGVPNVPNSLKISPSLWID